MLERGVCAAVDVDGLPVHVLRAAQGKVQHAGAHGVVGEAVDHDEAAQVAVLRIGFEHHRLIQVQVAHADLVQLQRARGQVLQRVDVDLVLGLCHRRAHRACAELEQIGAAGQHGLFVHPHQRGFKLIRHGGLVFSAHQYVPAADVDLVFQRERDGLAAHRLRAVTIGTVGTDDAGHAALAAGGQRAQPVTHAHFTRADGARKAAEIQVGAVDPLHRQAERLLLRGRTVDRHVFQVRHQRRALVPRRVAAWLGDVVTAQGRHRNADDVRQADLLRKRAVFAFDGVMDLLRVADHVQLVDGHHHAADAERGYQVAVAARLRLHAAARIHQQHGQVGGRGAGHHVAGVLLVSRGVRHDELALVGGKESVGHVDGDALFALCGQAVHQQREVELVALRAHLLGVGFELRELVFKQHFRLVQQPADQGALAIVDAAAGDEAQQALVLLGMQVLCDVVVRRLRHRVCQSRRGFQ